MNKTELERAIKKGESVWVANKYCYPYKVKLTNKHYVGVINDIKCLMLAFQNEDDELIDYLEYIFETKEKAQHYHDHANISRTEQLPFYTFSEIAKDEKNFKMGKTYTLIEDKNFVLDINKSYVSQIVLYTSKEKYSWNFNEENFYKAYDEAVRFFNGE